MHLFLAVPVFGTHLLAAARYFPITQSWFVSGLYTTFFVAKHVSFAVNSNCTVSFIAHFQGTLRQRVHVHGEGDVTAVCRQVHQGQAVAARRDEAGDHDHEQSAPPQAAAAVGRVRVAARDDPRHGAVSRR